MSVEVTNFFVFVFLVNTMLLHVHSPQVDFPTVTLRYTRGRGSKMLKFSVTVTVVVLLWVELIIDIVTLITSIKYE